MLTWCSDKSRTSWSPLSCLGTCLSVHCHCFCRYTHVIMKSKTADGSKSGFRFDKTCKSRHNKTFWFSITVAVWNFWFFWMSSLFFVGVLTFDPGWVMRVGCVEYYRTFKFWINVTGGRFGRTGPLVILNKAGTFSYMYAIVPLNIKVFHWIVPQRKTAV